MARMDVLQEFQDIFLEELQALNIEEWKAKAAAINLTESLRRKMGGSPIYIPVESAISREQRNWLIVSQFDGTNHYVLSRKFNLSVNQIYLILREARNAV